MKNKAEQLSKTLIDVHNESPYARIDYDSRVAKRFEKLILKFFTEVAGAQREACANQVNPELGNVIYAGPIKYKIQNTPLVTNKQP